MVGITPYGAVQFQDFYTPAYSETDVTGGGFGLTYNATNATDVRTELGVPRRPRFGRYRGLSGPKADIAETTLLTQLRHVLPPQHADDGLTSCSIPLIFM